jgi:pimeloyl-ACP methyl ester carboxylesterase
MKNNLVILLFLTLSLKVFSASSRDVSGKYSYADSLLTYKNKNGQKVPVKTLADWERKRLQVLAGMQQVMGPLPTMKGLPPLNIQYIDSVKEDNFTCYGIKFTVANNEILPALLYVPHQKGKPKKLAAMVVLHGTDVLGKKILSGISPKPNRAYAKEMAQRGYVVIAPDYPSFGDLENYDFKTDRYQSGTMKAIFNHIRCVDLLQARPDVDPNRIGVIGHSLGGHNAIFLGAFDKRIKVIVASCGWTLFDSYDIGEAGTKKYGGKIGPWAQDRYMPLLRDKYKLDVTQVPFDFDEAIATLAPRPFFSNSPLNDANFSVAGVKRGISNIAEVYKFLNVPANLQVRYPEATHDFPPAERLEAYQFIDKVLKHKPAEHQLLP